MAGAWLGLVALLAAGTGAAGEDLEASRGRKQSLPTTPRGPKMPEKLPAAAPGAQPLAAGEVRREAPGAGYSDSLDRMGQAAASFERSALASYAYCLRTTATYEYLRYGEGGALQRGLARSVQHGTAFGIRIEGDQTLLATNAHVASMPEVSSEETPVEGVPAGARKVWEINQLVRGEGEEGGAVALSPVLVDQASDLAVLRAPARLPVVPYRLGRSSSLEVGDVVFARGCPLGVMQSSNVGRVTNASQPDVEGKWDHLDFVTDAALNNGNSGSPVFAVSEASGEPELVGIFHARFRGATGMGVVVGIDGIRQQLTTLTVPARAELLVTAAEGPELLAKAGRPVFFPFAGTTVRATLAGAGAHFEVFLDFPETEAVQLLLASDEDGPRVLLAPPADAELDARMRQPLEVLERELWKGLASALRLREAVRLSDGSAGARRKIALLRKALVGRADSQRDLLSVVRFERERLQEAPSRAAGALDAAPAR